MLTLHFYPASPLRLLAETALLGNRNTVMIVPEQLSHEAERMLGSVGGPESCLRAEVLSFTRMAQRFFALYGGAARKKLDNAGRILAMSLAAEELRSKIKYFASALTRVDFLQELLQMVDELKACCVEPDQLLQAAKLLTGETAQKCTELGLLLESYAAVCASAGSDPRDDLTILAARLPETDYAEDRRFCIGGFLDFTAQEQRVIEALLRSGAQVEVFLCCEDLQEDNACFVSAARAGRRLRSMAGRIGVKVETKRHLPQFFPEQAYLLKHLYDGTAEAWSGTPSALALCLAPDAQTECRLAAEEIYRALLDGARCREIGVALCDESQRLLLQQLLQTRGIAVYTSGAADARTRALFAFVLCALDAVSGGYRRDQVIGYLRTGLGPLTDDETDVLENYAIAWNLRGGRWFRPFTEHPDGYDGKMDETARSALDQLNLLRVRAMAPLQALEQALRRAKTAREQAEALYAFLEQTQLSCKLEEQHTRLTEQGKLQLAAEQAQLYTILTQALEQLYALGGTAARTPEGFSRMVQLLLGQYHVSTIPAALDAVTLGSLSDLRGRSFDRLLILGTSDGAFPAFTRRQSLLCDEERDLLRAGGIELPPESEQLERSVLNVYSVLSGAGSRLYLSCSETAGQPAYLFSRFCRQFPAAMRMPSDPLWSDYSSIEACAARAAEDPDHLPELPESSAEQVLTARDLLLERASYDPGKLSQEAVQALYGAVMSLSPSRLDRLAGCRMGYYLEYGLKLKQRREFKFDAPIFGTFVHAVLENTVQAVEDAGGFAAVSDEQIRTLTERSIRAFTEEQMNGLAGKEERFVYLYERNRDEIVDILRQLSREMRKSDFHARSFELRFAPDGALPAIPIEGAAAAAQIIGVVDRADLCELDGKQQLRIVDYKTGSKTMDYAALSIGEGMQMLIYLFALKKLGLPGAAGRLTPAGVLYFPAHERILSADHRLTEEEAEEKRRKEWKRSGLLTDDETLLQAMEHSDGDPEFLPYKTTKSTGERKGDLVAPEQWPILERHVERKLKEFVNELAGGEVAPNPYVRGAGKSSCTYCPYETVCRFDASGGCYRSYRAIKPDEFWNELEEKEHG